MEIRAAEPDDRERISAIARDSLQSSSSLSPQQLEMILEAASDDPSLADPLDDADTTVLVADETIDGTGAVYVFITVDIGDRATIRWLHVDPETRGNGIATALLGRVREAFDGTPIAAAVLEDAVEGGAFRKGFGLEESSHDQIPIGDEEFDVTTFVEGDGTVTSNEPTVPVPESVTVDGGDRPINRDESVPGRGPRSSRWTSGRARASRTGTSVRSVVAPTSPPTDRKDSSAMPAGTLTWPMSETMRTAEAASSRRPGRAFPTGRAAGGPHAARRQSAD